MTKWYLFENIYRIKLDNRLYIFFRNLEEIEKSVQPPMAAITTAINLGIESHTDWKTSTGTSVYASSPS